MTIRLATLADLSVLARLVAETAAELEEKHGTPNASAVMVTILRYGIEGGQAVVVAEQGGEIVGWCARVITPGFADTIAQGVGKWTRPDLRRDHICRDMCRFADEHAYQQGARLLLGEVARDNAAGIRSALADGWEITGYTIRKVLTDGKEKAEAPAEAGLLNDSAATPEVR